MDKFLLLNKIFLFFSFLINLAGGYFISRFTGCLIDIKKKRRYPVIITAGYSFICMTIIFRGDAFNICAVLILGTLLIFYCTKGSLAAKTATIMIIFPLILAISYIQHNNAFSDSIITYSIYENPSGIGRFTRSIYILISDGIKSAVFFLLYRTFEKRLNQIKIYMKPETWWYIVGISSVSFASFTAVVVSPPAVYNTNNDNMQLLPVMSWIIVAASIITNLCILLLLPPLIDSVRFRMEKQKDILKEEYYNILEAQQKQTGKMKHDINNHFQMLQTYLETGEFERAKDYLKHMKMSPVPAGGKVFCKDKALNAMLNIRYEKLMSVCGNVHFNLDLPDDMGIEVFDLCTIFTNTIDNALEAVSKIDDFDKRRVVVRARCENRFFGYQIINSKCNIIRENKNRLLSDKTDGKHGFGLENVREIIEKYDGEMNISHTEDEFSLVVCIFV